MYSHSFLVYGPKESWIRTRHFCIATRDCNVMNKISYTVIFIDYEHKKINKHLTNQQIKRILIYFDVQTEGCVNIE